MSTWRPPSDDLALPRLLAEASEVRATGVAEPADLASELSRVEPAHPTSVTGLFRARSAGALRSLLEAAHEYGGLLAGGLDSLVMLHTAPAREVIIPDGSAVLLTPVIVDGEVLVVTATWAVTRLPNLAPQDGHIVGVDEFHVARELTRLEQMLCDWATSSEYIPEHPRLRAVCVVTADALAALPGLANRLGAMAGVWCAELDIVVAEHDPRDTRLHTLFERAALSNRYRLMVTLSHPQAKWVWRLARRFKDAKREHRALPLTSVPDVVDEFAGVIAAVSQALPDRPTQYWGSDAVSRIEARIGESFALSDRAWGHLVRNRYPWPERLLSHVERLADVADEWSARKAAGDAAVERLEDWVRSEFGLKIALHDKGLREKDAYFVFEGQRLCNRPHVKVDDYASPSECGRVYFGIDERPPLKVCRFVVDHIGLHDRS
jgi:hypothetical protein